MLLALKLKYFPVTYIHTKIAKYIKEVATGALDIPKYNTEIK